MYFSSFYIKIVGYSVIRVLIEYFLVTFKEDIVIFPRFNDVLDVIIVFVGENTLVSK